VQGQQHVGIVSFFFGMIKILKFIILNYAKLKSIKPQCLLNLCILEFKYVNILTIPTKATQYLDAVGLILL
jgi:hypothetical protein